MMSWYYVLVSRRDTAALLIAVAVFAVYANSLENPFHYDDRHSIVENPHLRSLDNTAEFFIRPEYFSRDPEKAMYRPLLLVTYAVNYAWEEYDVFGWHLVNVLLHLLCSFLVMGILSSLGQPPCMALLGALFFALHPVASEPVNYISSRSELLAGAGVLSGLLFYLRGLGRWGWILASAACLAAGLMGKSVALILPVWIALWEWQAGSLLRNWFRLLPHVLVALCYVLAMQAFLVRALLTEPVRGWSEQAGTQIKALIHYAALLLTPWKVSVDHAFAVSGIGEPLVWLCAATLASLFFLARNSARLGLLWLLVALLPTMVVPLNVLVNDHRLYLPLVGLILALLGLRNIAEIPGIRLGAPVFLALMASLTWDRNGVWSSELSLWGDAHGKNPSSVRPLVYLGNASRNEGDPVAAKAYYQRALAIEPENPTVRANLANAYGDMGRHDLAVVQLERALTDWPSITDLHYSLGRSLQMSGRPWEAVVHYRSVPMQSPHRTLADNMIGTLFEGAAEIDSALIYYGRAAGLREADDNYRRLFAAELRRIRQMLDRGQLYEAEAAVRELGGALSDNRDVRFMLAVTLFLQRRYTESLTVNLDLVKRHPEYDEGLLQLALVQETIGLFDDATATYGLLVQRTRQPEMIRIGVERLRALQERMP